MAHYHPPYTQEYLSRHPTHFKNEPTSRHESLMKVMSHILINLSSIVGKQILVDSCYRCPQVNAVLGGHRASFHTIGSAIDILTSNLSDNDITTLVNAIRSYHPCELVVHPRHIHVAFDVSRLGNYGKIMTWQQEHPSEFPVAELKVADKDSDL